MRLSGKTIALSLLVVVLVGAGVYALLRREDIEEAVELIAEGGERVLREPMRPASQSEARVVVIAFDGVGSDALAEAIEQGYLPTVSALLGATTAPDGVFPQGYSVPNVLSVLPSTTLAAWSSIFTGQPPGMTGAPGNEWFDRRTAEYFAPAPVSVSGIDHALEVYTESLFSDVIATPTLYELADVRSHVALMHVHRGADVLTMPDLGALDELMAGFIEGLTEETEVKQEVYQELDNLSVDGAIEAIEEHGIPDLQTVYFPGIDLFTHVAEGPQEAQRRYLREAIDPALARLMEVYRAAGALESTYWVFVSDHGHTPVLEDDRHALESEGESEPPTILEQSGFRLRPMTLEVDDDEADFQATVAYQGAFAYLYLADRSSCAEEGTVCDWARAPRWEEDVIPVARAYDAANRTGAGAPELQGTIDLILARDRSGGTEEPEFGVWAGDRLMSMDEYLAANPRPDLLRFRERMAQLATGPHGDRAGDILLMSSSGSEVDIQRRFYFSHSYRSWHGSATPGDSRVPLLVTGAGRSGEEIREQITPALGANPSHLDIVPVVLRLLGREAA